MPMHPCSTSNDPLQALRSLGGAAVARAGALALGALLAAPLCADGSGQLGLALQFRGPGAGYLVATDPATDAGTIVVAGIPAGVTVTRVFFYCLDTASAPSITGATLAGQPVTLALVGTMNGSAPAASVHVYRADVTALVPGSGDYPWTTASGGTNHGAFIALFGFNPGDTDVWEVQLRDGAHGGVTADGVDLVWPNPTVFDGFLGSPAWPADASLAWVVAGGQPGLGEEYLVGGTSIAGTDPATGGLDWSEYSIPNLVTPATTSVTASCRELGDAIVWAAGILRLRSCDACPVPFCAADPGAPVPCPCANPGGSERGCSSSNGPGALLSTVGSTHPDRIVFHVDGGMPSALHVVFQGDAAVAAAPFGDGLRCVGGRLLRLYTRAADGGGSLDVPQPTDPTVSQRSASQGDPLVPGATRWYQVWYRDANAAFCGSELFNASSGLAIPW